MTAPNDIAKVLDEFDAEVRDWPRDGELAEFVLKLSAIARAADAFERFVAQTTPDTSYADIERGFAMELVLRAALDALANGGD